MKIAKKTKKEEPKINELVSRGCFLSREIKAIKDPAKPMEKDLEAIKKDILSYYATMKKDEKKAQSFTLQGLNVSDSMTLSESEIIDPKKLFDAMDNDIEAFLGIVTVSKTAAENILSKNVVSGCLVKSTGNPKISFK